MPTNPLNGTEQLFVGGATPGYVTPQQIVDLALTKIPSGAPADGDAVSFRALFTGAAPSTVERKGQQVRSILDVNGRVPGVTYDAYPEFAIINLLAGEWVIPAGIHQISKSNPVGWPGWYRFEPGAKLQAAKGVTTLWDGAHWEANPYQQIIDPSAGGMHAGKLRNSDFSICWTGADPTGTQPSGPAVQAAFDYKLVRRILAPHTMDGRYYAMKDARIVQTLHLHGPTDATLEPGNSPVFYWDTDLGKAGDPTTTSNAYWRMPALQDRPDSLAQLSLRGVTLRAPSNPTARSLTPFWNTDLLAIGRVGDTGNGNTNTIQASIEKVVFDGGRFGSLARSGNGHTTHKDCQFIGNFAGAASVATGGDYRYLDCNGVNFQCAMFYHWANTGWEQGIIVRDLYAGMLPYMFYQSPANHPDKASTTGQGITVGGEFTNVKTENLGNAFIQGLPTSYLASCIFTNVVHDLLWYGDNSGTIIAGQQRDYAIDLGGVVNCRMTFGKDGSGLCTFGPGKVGVIRAANVIAGEFDHFIQRSTLPYFCAPQVQVRMRPMAYASPTIQFQAAGTVQDGLANATYGYGGHSDGRTFDYVLSREERECHFYLAPSFSWTYGDGSIGASCTLYNSDRTNGRKDGFASPGAFIRITLSKPVTATAYGTLTLFAA